MTAHSGLVSSRRPRSFALILVGLATTAVVAVIAAATGIQAILALAAGVLILACAVYLPGVPLALYFLIPLYKGALQPFSPIDLTVLLAIANAAQVVPVLLEPRHRHISVAGLALWMGLAIVVLAGVLYAPDQTVALGRTIDAWALLFIPIVPAAIRVGSQERFLRQVVLTFLAAGIVTVVLGLAALTGSDRLRVFDTNTIWTGRAALLVPLLAMLFVPQVSSIALRLAAVVASILAVLVALASGSRGPLIALLLLGAIGFVRALASPRGIDRRALVLVVLFAVAGVAIVVSGAIDLPEASTARFVGLGEFVGNALDAAPDAPVGDTSSQARVRLFGFALELFAEQPVTGAGTAGYPVLSPAAVGDFEANAYPHNAFLQVAAEHGLIGLVILGALVVLALTRRLPARTYGNAIRLLFAYFLLNAMVSGDVFDDRATWGLMMLILLMDIPARQVDSGAVRPTGQESGGLGPAAPLPWPPTLVPAPGPYPAPPRLARVQADRPAPSGSGGIRGRSPSGPPDHG
jgi:O-antigen ligase